jgi:antitoxin HicB
MQNSNEYSIKLEIEKLPEGLYLASSWDLPGLLAQGRTISETVEIARDVTKKLIESYIEYGDPLPDTLNPIYQTVELQNNIIINNRASNILGNKKEKLKWCVHDVIYREIL